MASYNLKHSQQAERCADQTSQNPRLFCSLPSAGTYDVSLFSSDQQYGQYEYVGQLEFNKE